MSTGAILLLTLEPTTPILIVAGLLSGAGGGLTITPLIVEMSRRSADADRGSAFSLLSAANAAALAIGSIGGALVVEVAGFEVAMALTLVGIATGAVIALLDQGLGRTPIAEPHAAAAPGS